MMKQQNITKAKYLGSILAKKINNEELEPNEKIAFDEWLMQNEKNRERYEKLISCQEHELSELLSLQDSIDRNCDHLMLRVSDYNKKRMKLRRLLATSSVAAAVLVLFMIYPVRISNKFPFEITMQKAPTKDTSIYLVSDNMKTVLLINEELTLSNVEVENPTITETVKMNTVIVPHSKSYKMTLSDGTKICINAGSQISFPERFSDDKRVVEVEGEVYFDVQKDENRPFIVKTAKFTTKVLGTSFLVSSYNDSETGNVSLVSGKVNVYNDNNSITLLKGKGVMITTSINKFKEYDIDMDKINSLLENKFIFINCRLDYIMSDVSRWYGVDVSLEDETLKEILFYIKTDKTRDLDQFMRWMSRTNNINYELKDNLLTIKKKI